MGSKSSSENDVMIKRAMNKQKSTLDLDSVPPLRLRFLLRSDRNQDEGRGASTAGSSALKCAQTTSGDL